MRLRITKVNRSSSLKLCGRERGEEEKRGEIREEREEEKENMLKSERKLKKGKNTLEFRSEDGIGHGR